MRILFSLALSLFGTAWAGDRIFVSNEASGTVSVIDGNSLKVVAEIPCGKRPRGIQPSVDGRHVYVALSGSAAGGPGVDESKLPPPDRKADGIGEIEVASLKIRRILESGADPEQFAVAPDGKIWVSNEDVGNASVIHPPSGARFEIPGVGTEPEGVAVSPDGKHVYVTSETNSWIAVISAGKKDVDDRIRVCARPRSVAFSGDGSRAYVTCEVAASIAVIDTKERRVIKTIKLPGEGILPMGIVIDDARKRAYVTAGRSGKLFSFDLVKEEVLGSLEVGKRPWGVALSSDGKRLFTANGPSNDISVVDLGKFKVVKRVPVGQKPWGVAVVSGR